MSRNRFSRVSMRGGVAFLQRARNAVEGGFMYRPGWFDAALQHQPGEPPKSHKGNVAELTCPEDRLLRRLAAKHPELWRDTVVDALPDDAGRQHYQHPAAAFVERQKHYVASGMTEEEAYEAVLVDWRRQKRFEKVELQVAMLQQEALGVDIPDSSPWEDRLEEAFQAALRQRLARDKQKRRENLEHLLARREAAGETEPLDLGQLDPAVTQADVEALLAADEKAQKHFGGDASSFHIEIEALLPKGGKGDTELRDFRDFLDAELPAEAKELLQNQPLPDDSRAKFFKVLDERVRERRVAEAEARRLRQAEEERLQRLEEEPEKQAASGSGKKGEAKKTDAKKKAAKKQ